MTTAAVLSRRRPTGIVVLGMVGPADPQVRSCIFCDQVFATGEAWLKIGFPRVAYIGAHGRCAERKDQELKERIR